MRNKSPTSAHLNAVVVVVMGVGLLGCKLERREALDIDGVGQADTSNPISVAVPGAAVDLELKPNEPAVVAFGPASGLVVDVSPAVGAALDRIRSGASASHAATSAARVLENVVCSATTRIGVTSQAPPDAAVMDATGKFGAVALSEDLRDPLGAALLVSKTPFVTLVGKRAAQFAELGGASPLPTVVPAAPAAPSHAADGGADEGAASIPGAPTAPAPIAPDTTAEALDHANTWYGVIVRATPEDFAVALSTRCMARMPTGSLGAVPIPGAAMFVGPEGAAVAVGSVDYVIRTQASRKVYGVIAQDTPPNVAVEQVMAGTPRASGIGFLVIGQNMMRIQSLRKLSWAAYPSPQMH